MVTVYIWSFRGKSEAWGHAAMQVDHSYISWWPEKPGQVPSGIHPNIYGSHPFRNRSFNDDVQAEGQPPDGIITLDGLNEAAIKDWWQTFGLSRDGVEYQGPLQSWDTLRRNCSTVVANGLHIGGGSKFSSWTKSWNLVWTPSDVHQFALSIKQGLGKRTASKP